MSSGWWFRSLLRLFPAPFRRHHGEELLNVVRAQAKRVRPRGIGPRVWFFLATSADLGWNAFRVRFEAQRKPAARSRPGPTRWTGIFRDLRHAGRMMVKQPGFSLIIVVTLGLGIGANAAIFTVVRGVLMAPLPFPDPDALVRVWENDTNEGRPHGNLSPADFFDYREQSKSLAGLGAFTSSAAVFVKSDEVERLPIQLFTPDVFDLLGVPALIGRYFRPDDVDPSRSRFVVLSYGFWQRQFGGDSTIVGRSLEFSSGSFEVLGVMPESFRPFGVTAELWAPWILGADDRPVRAVHFIRAIGRLRSDVSLDEARADLGVIARRLERENPGVNDGHLVTIETLEEATVGQVRMGLLLMAGAVGLVLLIACANIANLCLSRGVGRRRELAVRSALGAGRGRLVRQLVTENLVLAALGGVVGLGIAAVGVDAFLALSPGTLPRQYNVQFNPVVVGFAVLLTVGAGLLFGLGPAALASHRDVHAALKSGMGWGTSAATHRLRRALVVVQMSLAMVLLIGAGLLLRSFNQVQRIDPGFEMQHLLTARMALPGSRYQGNGSVAEFQRTLAERLEGTDQVQRVGTVTFLPLTGNSATAWLNIVGRPPWSGTPPEVNIINMSGDYFRAMGVSLLAGRMFDDRDQEGTALVTVVNRSLAEQFFPDEDPVGQHLRLGPNPDAQPFEIIGVVSDMRQEGLATAPAPASFSLSRQGAWSGFTVVVQTAGPPAAVAPLLRAAVREIDPKLPVYDVATMTDLVGASVARPRFSTTLLGAFAAIALIIASVGVYGVIAYSVSQRTREMGIRMALGARASGVRRLVLREALLLAGCAVAVGVGAALLASRRLAGMLYGTAPTDPVTFAVVPTILVTVATIASWLPARRASHVDPAVALREE